VVRAQGASRGKGGQVEAVQMAAGACVRRVEAARDNRWAGKPTATKTTARTGGGSGAPIQAEEEGRRKKQGWFHNFPKSQGPN